MQGVWSFCRQDRAVAGELLWCAGKGAAVLLCPYRRGRVQAAMKHFLTASSLLRLPDTAEVIGVKDTQSYCSQHRGAALRQRRKQGLEVHTDVPSSSLSHICICSSPSAALVTEETSQRPLRSGNCCVSRRQSRRGMWWCPECRAECSRGSMETT